jgi:hypothetical protein
LDLTGRSQTTWKGNEIGATPRQTSPLQKDRTMNRLLVFLPVLTICAALIHGGNAVANDALQLTIGQSDLLHKEPVLVTLRLQHSAVRALPSKPGEGDGGTLRFEFDPAVQPRAKGKALHLEAGKKHNAAVLKKYGATNRTRSAVHLLATGLTDRIARTPGAE